MEQFSIGADLESAAARRNESERRDALAEFKNLGRQTDGLRRVVSNDAVFDRDFGFHPELLSDVKLSVRLNAVKTLQRKVVYHFDRQKNCNGGNRYGVVLHAKALRQEARPHEKAFSIVHQLTGEVPKQDPNEGKNPAAVALGRLGGLKGGKARAEGMSARQRKQSAKKAAAAR
jgi:hypothetical protein